VRVLKWGTPLEGILGPVFEVKRDGAVLAYQGRMVKRGDPEADEYVLIEPGGSVSATVDLAPAYDVAAPGEYEATFVGRLTDVVADGESVPRPRRAHKSCDLPRESVLFRVVR
jgi:hypothetical protein